MLENRRDKSVQIKCGYCDTFNSGHNESCDVCQGELNVEEEQVREDLNKRKGKPIKIHLYEKEEERSQMHWNECAGGVGVTSRPSPSPPGVGNNGARNADVLLTSKVAATSEPSSSAWEGVWICTLCSFDKNTAKDTCGICGYERDKSQVTNSGGYPQSDPRNDYNRVVKGEKENAEVNDEGAGGGVCATTVQGSCVAVFNQSAGSYGDAGSGNTGMSQELTHRRTESNTVANSDGVNEGGRKANNNSRNVETRCTKPWNEVAKMNGGNRLDPLIGLNDGAVDEEKQIPPAHQSKVGATQKKGAASTPPGGWNCTACSFINGARNKNCEVCGFGRYDKPREPLASGGRGDDEGKKTQPNNRGMARRRGSGGAGQFQSMRLVTTTSKGGLESRFHDDTTVEDGVQGGSWGEWDKPINSGKQRGNNDDANRDRRGGDRGGRCERSDVTTQKGTEEGGVGGGGSSQSSSVEGGGGTPRHSNGNCRRVSWSIESKNIRGEENNVWSCPSCTFNNKIGSRCCEVCFTFQEPAGGEEPEDVDEVVEVDEMREATWRCRHCSKDNLFDTYICLSCKKFAPFFHKWVCERCAFFNEELAELCFVCQYKNNHLRKCDKCKINAVHVDGKVRQCAQCVEQEGSILIDRPGRGVQGNQSGKMNTPNIQNEDVSKGDEPQVCAQCSKVLGVAEDTVCRKCTESRYYCNNRHCGAVNDSKARHCKKCKLKKGANVTDFNTVDLHDGSTYVKMWQCTFCGLFNNKGKKNSKCDKCKNMQHNPAYKKCFCGWNNLSIRSSCDICFKVL